MPDARNDPICTRRTALLAAAATVLGAAILMQPAVGSAEADRAREVATPRVADRHQGAPATASSWRSAARRGNDGLSRTAWRSRGEVRPWWQVDLGRAVRIRDVRVNWAKGARPKRIQILVSSDGDRFHPIDSPRAGHARLLSGRGKLGRFVRVRMAATPGARVGISEVHVHDTARRVERAAGRPARASSARGGAARGNDGRGRTRWVSGRGGRHWWQVDLGSNLLVDAVSVRWGRAAPRDYVVRVSRDGRRFRSVSGRRSADAGWRRTGLPGVRARYVRVVARAQRMTRPVSLHEVRVFGPLVSGSKSPRGGSAGGAGSAPGGAALARTGGAVGSTAGTGGSPQAPPALPRGPLEVGLAAGGNLQYLDDESLAERLDIATALGLDWMRVDVHWSQVQAGGRRSYDWAASDRLVGELLARGITPVGMIGYTPGWARPADCTASDKCPPASPEEYASFAAAVASRYGPLGVRHWEIWNEPNVSDFWRPGPEPTEYAGLLQAAEKRIRAVQPEATIISGGLAPYGAPGDQSATRMNPVTFLERMYGAGAKGAFDALGMHPYSQPVAPRPGHPAVAWSQLESTNPSVRSVMTANGDAGLDVWATEFGYPTCDNEANCVSEAAQAQFTRDAISAWSSYGWAGPMMLYQLADAGVPNGEQNRFGMLRSDLSEKPVAGVVRSMLTS